ncbi:putative epidermal cell surface receptor, partial [Orchesella cincta]
TEGSDELHTVVVGLSGGQQYYFKALIKGFESDAASGITKLQDHAAGSVHSEEAGSGSVEGHSDSMEHLMLGGSEEEDDAEIKVDSGSVSSEGVPCKHKDKMYDPGMEFYDGCDAYCLCDGKGNVTCVEIDCPRDGRELIDESCVKWEPDLSNFRKEAPYCCPDMICVQHTHCELEGGYILQNFEEIPHKLTGCEKTCQCLYGNITCHPGTNCPSISQHPPAALACPPEMASQVPMLENECCYQWACLNHTDGIKTLDGLPNQNLNRHTTPSTTHTHSDSHDNSVTNLTLAKLPLEPFIHDNTHDHHHQNGDHHHNNHDDTDEDNEEINEHEQEHDRHPDYDQYVPPSSGNRPSIVGLDKLNPADLQEILHHLVNLGGESQERPQGPSRQPTFVPGAYTTVQTEQEVAALEREAGGRFIGRAEDGSYIVAVPQPQHQNSPPNSVPPYPHVGRGPGPRPRPGGGPPLRQILSHPNAPSAQGFPGHFPPPPPPFGLGHQHPGSQHPNDAAQVSNIIIQPLNESTLQIDFTVSPILVGLHGHVEVLYTKDFIRKPNPAQWESKVFQQAEDLIDNTHLQLFLTSLEPDTDYHMQIKVVVMAQFQPTSDVLLVRTPAPSIPTTTLPPEILVDPVIQLASSGSRTVKLHWKRFDDYDTLIDGVQIAYKESEDKVYQTTPLIHRTVTEYELTNLKPDKDYEVNLLFIPFHTDQKTILKSEKPIFIKTDKEEDEYAFDLALSSGKVSENSIELKVAGVPIPEDKFVQIYQVFYSSDSEKEQKNYFKVPKSETSKRATLTELRPGTKYTIWLEAFLSNGKKKRSNVIDVITKAGQLPSPEKSEQETLQESKPELPQTSSYYGALVALAIVAAMSILGIIALLMILIKKQNQAKAPINDRKSESSYDNPSFKSYDVESNGHIKPGEL